jgi:hypothetical protein
MNGSLTALAIVTALLVSADVFAAQPTGRDSVYAASASTLPSAKVAQPHAGNGRGSVYAADLPAPTPRSAEIGAVTSKPGRA